MSTYTLNGVRYSYQPMRGSPYAVVTRLEIDGEHVWKVGESRYMFKGDGPHAAVAFYAYLDTVRER
jgi:hypothetical protein